jgi:hypothetical protein
VDPRYGRLEGVLSWLFCMSMETLLVGLCQLQHFEFLKKVACEGSNVGM